jgi:hypothetical protein
VPTRRYLLQALPIALEALNVYSEAEREGYDTATPLAHARSSNLVFSVPTDNKGPVLHLLQASTFFLRSTPYIV